MWAISQPAKEILASQKRTLLHEFNYIITKILPSWWYWVTAHNMLICYEEKLLALWRTTLIQLSMTAYMPLPSIFEGCLLYLQPENVLCYTDKGPYTAWVVNPWPIRLYFAACSYISKICTYPKIYIII